MATTKILIFPANFYLFFSEMCGNQQKLHVQTSQEEHGGVRNFASEETRFEGERHSVCTITKQPGVPYHRLRYTTGWMHI